MFALRYEIIVPDTPSAALRGDVLYPPIMSGTIARNSPAPNAPVESLDTGIYAPSDPITIPETPQGWNSLLLVLESLGAVDWIVSVAPRGQTPQPAVPELQGPDLVPTFVVPASMVRDSIMRSREIRSVRPGSSFVARPRLYRTDMPRDG